MSKTRVLIYHPVSGERVEATLNKNPINSNTHPLFVDGFFLCHIDGVVASHLPVIHDVPEKRSDQIEMIIACIQECLDDDKLVVSIADGTVFSISVGLKKTTVTGAGAVMVKAFGVSPLQSQTIGKIYQRGSDRRELCFLADELLRGKYGLPSWSDEGPHTEWFLEAWKYLALLRKDGL